MAFCVNGGKDMYEQTKRRIELLCHTLKAERGDGNIGFFICINHSKHF